MNTPNLVQATRWNESVEKRLVCIWKEKSIHVLTHSNLKETFLKLEPSEEWEESRAEDMTQTVDFFEGVLAQFCWPPELRNLVGRAIRLVREEVEYIVAMHGLKALKAMVKKGAFNMR